LFQAALNAAVEAGYPISEDFNGYMQDGFGTYDLTIKDGMRIGAAKAYLQDTKQRKNVEIFIKTNVQKILFENLKAIGIQIMIKGKLENIYANKEVIVASGSINSPKLLQLSGIGDEHELRQLGIKVIEKKDGLVLKNSKNLIGADLNSENDHRLFMAFCIAGMYVGNCSVSHPESVKISYPNFIQEMKRIGCKISLD